MTSVVELVGRVKGPRPVMTKERERALTGRQRQVLDRLHDEFAQGFSHLTMADLAAAGSCSLRTIYELAPSRDELVRLVVDRRLWSIGRSAVGVVDENATPLEAIRLYLRAANVAVATITEAFAIDCRSEPGTAAVQKAHGQYLIDVTRALLDEAVDRDEIAQVDTAALARTMANVAADLSDPEVLPTIGTPPDQAADAIIDIIITGLGQGRPGRRRDGHWETVTEGG